MAQPLSDTERTRLKDMLREVENSKMFMQTPIARKAFDTIEHALNHALFWDCEARLDEQEKG